MVSPRLLPLGRCVDAALAGGKAAGLARLIAGGFPVPPGICVTTEAYRQALSQAGFSDREQWSLMLRTAEDRRSSLLGDCRSAIEGLDVTALASEILEALSPSSRQLKGRWAVRSSATNEDQERASFAGLYRTKLGIPSSGLANAVKELWASIWDESIMNYLAKFCPSLGPPAMAVVIQPMVEAAAAGVANSIHPVTGQATQVAIDAVFGLAASLVDGTVTPDHIVVRADPSGEPIAIHRHTVAFKMEQLTADEQGIHSDSLPEPIRSAPVLSDEQACALARMTKQVERAFGSPVDIEWAFEARQLWLLQARPITAVKPSFELTNEDCEWSRANFKETMPDVPSPVGCSFLERFMEDYIVAHYRRLGCRIPKGLASVRILSGRPYLNVSLFHLLVGQLGGDTSLLAEQLGGKPLEFPPAIQPLRGLRLARAALLILLEMWRVEKEGPRCFREMKDLAETCRRDRIATLSYEELAVKLDDLGHWLAGREVTFGIAAGVGQCLQTFSRLLPGWLGPEWRSLLNDALQGQGNVISAQQILRLSELVELARAETVVATELRRGRWEAGSYRQRLNASKFLPAFNRYLDDYGHRGLGESDIMSPRWSDRPEALLEVIAVQLRGPGKSPADVFERQREVRTKALAEIKSRCGRRLDRWWIFHWWYRRLCRYFALREANRHHLMYYSTAVRSLWLRLGECLVGIGTLAAPEDIFFLTMEEQRDLVSGKGAHWLDVVTRRRAERAEWMKVMVPDAICGWRNTEHEKASTSETAVLLRGVPISSGVVTGSARVVRSAGDWAQVRSGDIVIVPVIDPGMAPLFGIAAGLVAELGGTLSHGAIIAREYGLPAVVNVSGAMRLFSDGEQIILDAGLGHVCRAHASVR